MAINNSQKNNSQKRSKVTSKALKDAAEAVVKALEGGTQKKMGRPPDDEHTSSLGVCLILISVYGILYKLNEVKVELT